tara:strand:- start:58436 stop:60643 length:2208 start_codon:yes stop_codon:yes gene_type:complete
MKKSLFLLLFFLGWMNSVIAQNTAITVSDPFISTWKMSVGETLTIPTPDTTLTYDFTIEWGDGSSETYNGTKLTVSHVYADSGLFDVSIDGSFPQLKLSDSPAAKQIRDVKQWGDIAWVDLEEAFRGADSLQITASDAPDLSGVTSLYMMFMDATSFNSNINHWDVSTISNFRYMFLRARSFNQPLDDWDMSSATNLQSMFYGAASFNQDLNDWDVSNVISLEQTFFQAYAFNGEISDWNTSSVITLSSTFFDAVAFNQPIGNWDVSKVRTMANTFARAYSFNQDLTNWDVSSNRDFFQTFRQSGFKGDVSTWDVSGATNFNLTFSYLGDYPGDISDWVITSASNLTDMFAGTNLTTEVYDSLLINWSELDGLNTGLTFNAGGSTYSEEGESARNTLVNDLSWTIYDAGKIVVEEPDTPSLVASYPFTGGSLLDEVGEKVAQATDVISAADRFGEEGNAVSFNGASSFINFGNSEDFQFGTGEFSFALWMKADEIQNSFVFGKRAGAASNFTQWSLTLSQAGAGTDNGSDLLMATRDSNQNSFGIVAYDMLGEWHHVAYTHNPTSGGKLYVDGELYQTMQLSAFGNLDVETNNLVAGYIEGENSNYFRGLLDDITIYNYEISESLIDSLFGDYEPNTGVSNEMNTDSPDEFVLKQNYPNPFNPSTNIHFDLPKSSVVNLEVYDLMGKRVATLVNERMGAGSHMVTFNASGLASGIYLYRIQAGNFIQTRKLTLIK